MKSGISITRTANAGVLVEMDSLTILLDGVCEQLSPYLGTPVAQREMLLSKMPDVLAFTHEHIDHYDVSYANIYQNKTLRPVLGPESLPLHEVEGVQIISSTTRHIGKCDIPHVSYVIKGSRNIWFMGDATPISLRGMAHLDKPDLLIVPFAYAITPSAWRMTKEIGAENIILLHMPLRENDPEGLWSMVESTVGEDKLIVIDIGQSINL